jgi:hypothetical protein
VPPVPPLAHVASTPLAHAASTCRFLWPQVVEPFHLLIKLRDGRWLRYDIPFFSKADLSSRGSPPSDTSAFLSLVDGGVPFFFSRPLGAALNHFLAATGEDTRRGYPLAEDPDDVRERRQKISTVTCGWLVGLRGFQDERDAGRDPLLLPSPGGSPVLWGHCLAAQPHAGGGVFARGSVPHLVGDDLATEVEGLTDEQVRV